MSTSLKILQEFWEYDRFRPLQEAIITAVLEGNDTFALMPTGGGKSICFQVPAMQKEGICIVISPLIALMQDQVAQLRKKGIKALALPSGIKYEELDTALDNCIYGNYKFLYLSPERLQQDIVQERIKLMNVNLIAIDEAHCISQWGHDFRPAYLKIKLLRILHPTTPIIALTASATPSVRTDIIKELDLFDPKVFKKSFFRENLSYLVYNSLDKKYSVEKILRKHPGPSIIYLRNRKAVKEFSDHLNQAGLLSTYYHGGIETAEKNKRFAQWMQEEIPIMVATNAFGMGIDKANVRTVIHCHLPESIESYFQEAGRAGRDQKKAYAYLLKSDHDIARVKDQFINVLPDISFVKHVYRKLCNYFQVSYGEGEQTKHNFYYTNFCKTYQLNPLLVFNTLQSLDRCGILRFTQHYSKKTAIHITVTGNQLLSYLHTNAEHALITKAILRTYTGVFEGEVPINISHIASRTHKTEQEVVHTLQHLEKAALIHFSYNETDAEIIFLVPREDDRTINRVSSYISEQTAAKIKKVQSIIQYIQNDSICRSQQLLAYFGEDDSQHCGICSNCLAKHTISKNTKEIKEQILFLLQEKERSSRELTDQLGIETSEILNCIQELVSEGVLIINSNNKYQLA
ncbi:RecQ family ATP-dependent DNA helicase [Aquimarina hainanensis]|uniref:ATP-dependent DNA helicase RecQ n=1 Tax=Aquimarina hainanensis TaxID=1578017 RepID=A0ABW5NCL8_9FLAO|nr:RecQ family ATP-dependent DNA helicase [Aquimarina sp. TRL1]QKX06910.1 RecQ family ATP-dependent DNA helicase [Aquimarina sp. TRL1]